MKGLFGLFGAVIGISITMVVIFLVLVALADKVRDAICDRSEKAENYYFNNSVNVDNATYSVCIIVAMAASIILTLLIF